MQYVIGVDIGTGSTKAVAVTADGKVLSTTQRHYKTRSPATGRYEQDPQEIWMAFVSAIRLLIVEVKTDPIGISFSSAMHSLIPVDQNGTGLRNMIIWADNRSGDIARRIHKSASGELIYEETGTPIHAMAPLSKLLWMREHEPDIFEKAYKFISIKEFIWKKLVGDFEVDESIASATGMMNITECSWSKNALALTGLSESKLSQLRKTNYKRTDLLDTAVSELGISPDTALVIGASDGCLANLGSFATTPGIAALTIGTSSAIRVASQKPIYNFEAMTFNYILDENTYISGGPSNNGGVALKWFAETFLQKPLNTIADYDSILKSLTETNPGAEGLLFLPYIFGERAPIWNSDACGVFFGVKGIHTQQHFTRAVIEGISMALLDIGDHMLSGKNEIRQINVSGGFVKSLSWLQILSDMFDRKICLVNSDDASAVGAAYLGLKTLGIINSYSELKHLTTREIIPDKTNHAFYQDQFIKYRDLYSRLKEVMV
jgi:gluconokinase